jgi:hypothetical protein
MHNFPTGTPPDKVKRIVKGENRVHFQDVQEHDARKLVGEYRTDAQRHKSTTLKGNTMTPQERAAKKAAEEKEIRIKEIHAKRDKDAAALADQRNADELTNEEYSEKLADVHGEAEHELRRL